MSYKYPCAILLWELLDWRMECFADRYDLLPLIFIHLQCLQEGVGYPLKSLLWPWLSGQTEGKQREYEKRQEQATRYCWHCGECLYTWNQSMVQQLIRDGNWRRRFLKASPMGLKATTMCKFCLQRATKKANRAKGLSSKFLLPAWAMGRTAWRKKKEWSHGVIIEKWICPV